MCTHGDHQAFVADQDAYTEARLVSFSRKLEDEGVSPLTVGHAVIRTLLDLSEAQREDPDFIYYVRDSFLFFAEDIGEPLDDLRLRDRLAENDPQIAGRLTSFVATMKQEGVSPLVIGHALIGLLFHLIDESRYEDPDFVFYVACCFIHDANAVEERVEAALRNKRAGGTGTYKQ
jgi:hypothetical protein